MRILAFSDWRVQSIDSLIDYVDGLEKRPDVILYGGDDVRRFGKVPKEEIIKRELKKIKNSLGFREWGTTFYSEDPLFRREGVLIFWVKSESKANIKKGFKEVLEKARLGKDDGSRASRFFKNLKAFLDLGKDFKINEALSCGELKLREDKGIGFLIFDNRSRKENKFEKLADLSEHGLFGVIGNDCSEIDKSILRKGDDVVDLHESPREIREYLFIGLEGTTKRAGLIGNVLYNERKIKEHLRNKKNGKDKKIILLSHCPPKGVLDFGRRFGERHIGSKSIREFIEEENVILNICGHCHLMGGRCKELDDCKVLNIASHDSKGSIGKVGLIDIERGEVNCNVVELTPSNLEAILGVGPKYSKDLEKAGIKTLEDLVALKPSEISRRTGISIKRIRKWHIRAKALIEDEVRLLDNFDIEDPIFFDIETNHSQTLVWMICILDLKNNRFKQFVADKPEEEDKMLREFLNFVSSQGYDRMYCYSGTDFDERVVLERVKENGLDGDKLPEVLDIYYQIRRNLVVPLTTYRLKKLASFFGFNWEHPDIDGLVAPVLHNEYLETGEQEIMRKLREYSRDDVLALKHIWKEIKEMDVERIKRKGPSEDLKRSEKIPERIKDEIKTTKKLRDEGHTFQEIADKFDKSIYYIYSRINSKYRPNKEYKPLEEDSD